ncbi:MAG TPA: complex I NDUFA9 subunit family protein [Thiobacillaceae bacterium]|nr:complex I NDUFA9 subunit family protein [Thiobacillaceae bacterium]
MYRESVCVIGGGGFVGRHLISRLAAQGRQVRVASRRREGAKHLLVLPGVRVDELDVHDETVLTDWAAGADAVVNLAGILHGTPQVFEKVHVELPAKLVAACRRQGVGRLLHMSALGADPEARSVYQQSKGRGEELVREAGLNDLATTIFRPSVIFGPGDSFLNLFAGLLKLAPVVPLAGASAHFQPVFVGDVARAFADSLDDPGCFGQTYNLCGPRVYTLAQLVRMAGRAVGRAPGVIPLNETLSFWFAAAMELKPGRKIMTRDNHYSMLTDNFCPDGFPARFGSATGLESVIGYLNEENPRTGYDLFRRRARR